jgi:hypothetical protein
VAEGKMMVDAAKAVGVDLLVWSPLESVVNISKGKYIHVDHFDGKGEITDYARKSGVPLLIVPAGWYSINHVRSNAYTPKKQADGSYVLGLPVGPNTVLPVIDTAHDYGLFVREGIESPAFGAGTEVLASGEDISVQEMADQLGQSVFLVFVRLNFLDDSVPSHGKESCLQADQRRRVYGCDQGFTPYCVGRS